MTTPEPKLPRPLRRQGRLEKAQSRRPAFAGHTDPECHTALSRRALLRWGAGAVTITALPLAAAAAPADVNAAIVKQFGTADIKDGKVTLTLPPIAENGYSVPLTVSVDSPMSEANYAKRVAIYAERNPLPDMAQFHFTPASGKADVKLRIRMGGTQTITAIAEMNDGALWRGTASTVVTLAACVIL